MANKVYRWKKPELTVSLTSGGTLAENTTYYIFGYFGDNTNTVGVYYLSHGPISDVSTFTTDTTNKSILVSWKCSGNITSFADGGSGKTLVTSPKYCLHTGNTITITSSSYSGTYSITEVDYDSFTINKAFVGDETGTWTCSVLPNKSNGLRLYISTVNPFNSSGIWVGSSTSWSTNYIQAGISANPVAVTAPYNTQYPTFNHWGGYNYAYKQYSELVYGVGKPAILIDTGTTTVATINQMIYEAGIENMNVVTNNFMRLTAHLNITTTNAITLTGYTILQEDINFKWSSMTLSYGVIISHHQLMRGIIGCNVSNSVVFSDSEVDWWPTPIAGTVNTQYVRPNTAYSEFHFNGYNIFGGWTWSYPVGDITNTNIYKSYLYMVYYAGQTGIQARTLKNVFLDMQGQSQFDIMMYSYTLADRTIIYENINTTRANNLKNVYFTGANNASNVIYFMRNGSTQVVDENNVGIPDVSVHIIDSELQEYNLISDTSGYVNIDVCEQKTTYGGYVYTGTITHYTNFVLTFSKDGYETQVQRYTIGKNITDALNNEKVWMIKSPSPVYYHQEIDGSICFPLLEGSIQSNLISGNINAPVLTGIINANSLVGIIT